MKIFYGIILVILEYLLNFTVNGVASKVRVVLFDFKTLGGVFLGFLCSISAKMWVDISGTDYSACSSHAFELRQYYPIQQCECAIVSDLPAGSGPFLASLSAFQGDNQADALLLSHTSDRSNSNIICVSYRSGFHKFMCSKERGAEASSLHVYLITKISGRDSECTYGGALITIFVGFNNKLR